MHGFKVLLPVALASILAQTSSAETLKEQRQDLIDKLQKIRGLSPGQAGAFRKILEASPVMGTGNPETTKHPQTREQCQSQLQKSKIDYQNPDFERICGGKYLAPLYDPATEKPEAAKACIDQFEFPNMPCEYPVVWAKANEAQLSCAAVGERLCDAHEWEGACDGALLPIDYPFAAVVGSAPSPAAANMRLLNNNKYREKKKWAYGPSYEKGTCGANSTKDVGCNGGDWKKCGSNTYPAGAFPNCKSSLQVYDQHGNAAEHMNLPLKAEQMTSTGSTTLGHTEMKGSWFIFDKFQAHEDWCRWRAPYWHGSRVMDGGSHSNYHLGFRCCKTLK